MKGQRLRNYWYNIYKTGLELYGITLNELKKPSKKSLEKARMFLKRAKKEWEQTHEEKAPSIREAYNRVIRIKQDQADYRDTPRDTETNRTETATDMYDASIDTIMEFFNKMEAIYTRSIDEINRTRTGTTHDDGFQGSIMDYKISDIDSAHTVMVELFNQFLSLSEPEIDTIAQKLKDSNEFDYEWAAVFVYPSDVVVNFIISAENLRTIWNSVVPS